MSAVSQNPIVAIISGQVVSIEGMGSLEQLMMTTRLAGNATSAGEVTVQRRPESLLTPEGVRANAGLTQLLSLLTHYVRSPVEVRRTTAVSNLEVPADVSLFWPAPTTHLHRFVRSCESGLISTESISIRSRLIAELFRAFPDHSFAVMTASVRDAKQVERRLRQHRIPVQRLRSQYAPRSVGRIVVGPFESLAHNEVELEKRDILIAYDARHALAERAQGPLTAPDLRCRLFGFISLDDSFSQRERDRLAATFGFQRCDVPGPGTQRVVVRTVQVPFRAARPTCESLGSLKRHGIWRCHHRNRLIARQAKEIGQGRRVVVLVDSLEHAACLCRRLPEWPVRIGGHAEPSLLPDRMRQDLARNLSLPISGPRLIATPAGLASASEFQFDDVFWAGSGPGLPPIPNALLMSPSRCDRDVLLHDVADRHDPTLRRWARSRRDAYETAEWFDLSLTAPPHVLRADSFLREREGVCQ